MRETEGSWKAHTRLVELGAAEVDHTLLWRGLSPPRTRTGNRGSLNRFALRLGCAGTSELVPCAACQTGSWDSGAAHATCCALGEATRAHDAVTTLVRAAAQSCDHTADTEVPGLILGTELRPADVPTSALGNAYTALHISICFPHSQQAGPDCTQSSLVSNLTTVAALPISLPTEHLQNPDQLERQWTTSSGHVDHFALPQSIHRAQTQFRLCRGRVPEAAFQHHPGDLETVAPVGPSRPSLHPGP